MRLLLFLQCSLAFATIMNSATREFIFACKNGQLEKAQKLLQQPEVDAHANNNMALKLATAMGQTQVVNFLTHGLEKWLQDIAFTSEQACIVPADPSVNEQEALRMACLKGDLLLVSRLLEDRRVDASVRDWEALVNAVKSGNVEVVRALLESGLVTASPEANDALKIAVEHRAFGMISLLMSHKTFRVGKGLDTIRKQLIQSPNEPDHLQVYQHLLFQPCFNHAQRLRMSIEDGQAWLVKMLVSKSERISEKEFHEIVQNVPEDRTEEFKALLPHPNLDLKHYFITACYRGFFDAAEDTLNCGRLELEKVYESAVKATVETKHTGIFAWLLALGIEGGVSADLLGGIMSRVFYKLCKSRFSRARHFIDIAFESNILNDFVLGEGLDIAYTTGDRNLFFAIVDAPDFIGIHGFDIKMLLNFFDHRNYAMVEKFWGFGAMKACVYISILNSFLAGTIGTETCWKPLIENFSDVRQLSVWSGNNSGKIIHELFCNKIMTLPSNLQPYSLILEQMSVDAAYAQFEEDYRYSKFGKTKSLAPFLGQIIVLHTLKPVFDQYQIMQELRDKILMELLEDQMDKYRQLKK